MDPRIAAAWAAGVRPRHTGTETDRWIISLGGNSYRTLANGPNLTDLGRRVRDELGWNEPDLSLDLFQTPTLRGRTEYLRLRSGIQVRGRWRVGDTWQYSARGREFYQRRIQLIVHVPVIERGVGDREWEVRDTFFPISGATLPGLIEEYVANRDVKGFVNANLGVRRNGDGERIVWEGSDVE